MKTPLDTCSSWFLDAAIASERRLSLRVTEGLRGDEAETIDIAGLHLEGHAIDASEERSRRFEIRFDRVVAWQVIDECYTVADTSEERDDDGILRVLTKSKYLDFIAKHHGWFTETVGPAAHFCLITVDDVVDVISHAPPRVLPWDESTAP